MYDNGKYVLPLKLVELLENSDLSFEELRLIHGLLHVAHVAVKGTPALLNSALAVSRKIRSTDLRNTVGPKNAKDHRQLIKVVESERMVKHFKVLALSPSHRMLTFQVQNRILDASNMRNFDPQKSKEPYALLSVSDIARCKTRTELLIYVRTAMHRRQRTPVFLLPNVGTADGATPWPAVRDKWLRSAVKEAAAADVRFLFLLDEGIEQLSVERVRVKFTHGETEWEPRTLYAFRLGTRFVEVLATGYRYLTVDEVIEKRPHTRVSTM